MSTHVRPALWPSKFVGRLLQSFGTRSPSRPSRWIHLGHGHSFQFRRRQLYGCGNIVCDWAIRAHGSGSLGPVRVERIRRWWRESDELSSADVPLLRSRHCAGGAGVYDCVLSWACLSCSVFLVMAASLLSFSQARSQSSKKCIKQHGCCKLDSSQPRLKPIRKPSYSALAMRPRRSDWLRLIVVSSNAGPSARSARITQACRLQKC